MVEEQPPPFLHERQSIEENKLDPPTVNEEDEKKVTTVESITATTPTTTKEVTFSAFKQVQLKHRRRANSLYRTDDLRDCLDFSDPKGDHHDLIIRLRTTLTTLPSSRSAPPSARQQEENQSSSDTLRYDGTPDSWESTIIPIYQGPMYGIRNIPGFLFFPQALGVDLQQELAYQSVTEYCESPHKTNLDNTFSSSSSLHEDHDPTPKIQDHSDIPQQPRMWDLWKANHPLRSSNNHHQENTIKNKTEESTTSKRIKKNPPPSSSSRLNSSSSNSNLRSFERLSWSTMGYHYDWTERSYHRERKSKMPILIERLSKLFAKTSLFMLETEKTNEQEVDDCCREDDNGLCSSSTSLAYSPTASIVNFYTMKSIMGGHRDDLELALDKPIVSISIGLSAIFLLGGKTKDDRPVIPIVIRSGDVLCMGGNCRLYYHGMARILPFGIADTPSNNNVENNEIDSNKDNRDKDVDPRGHDNTDDYDEKKIVTLSTLGLLATTATTKNSDRSNDGNNNYDDHEYLKIFLKDHRLNINVRQVYPDDGQQS